MSNEKLRSYTDMQRNTSQKDLDQFARDIAISYATSELHYSRSYYTSKYIVNSSCFTKLLERAVVCDLVSDEIVNKMRKKAYRNSNIKSIEYSGDGTIATEVHYSKMIGERKWFKFLRDFPEEDKIKITTYFAEHFEVSKAECAKKFNLSTIELGKIIEDTLLKNKVDDEIFSKIRTRSLGDNPSESSIKYFATLKRKRNKMKRATN